MNIGWGVKICFGGISGGWMVVGEAKAFDFNKKVVEQDGYG